jgi:hypothetical protein
LESGQVEEEYSGFGRATTKKEESLVSDNTRNTFWAFAITAALILISLIYVKANVYYIYLVVYIWFGFAGASASPRRRETSLPPGCREWPSAS